MLRNRHQSIATHQRKDDMEKNKNRKSFVTTFENNSAYNDVPLGTFFALFCFGFGFLVDNLFCCVCWVFCIVTDTAIFVA